MPRGRKRANPETSPSLGESEVVGVKVSEVEIPVEIHVKSKPKYEPPKSPRWTLQDPKLTDRQREEQSRWIAVFKCHNPEKFHKTKAYNDTPESEVPCHVCGWPTTMDPMFLRPPINWRTRVVREKERDDFEGAING